MSLLGSRAAIRELMRVKQVRIWRRCLNKITERSWEATVVKNSSSLVTIVLENAPFFNGETPLNFDDAILELDDGSEIPLNTWRYAVESGGDKLLFIRIEP